MTYVLHWECNPKVAFTFSFHDINEHFNKDMSITLENVTPRVP